MGKRVRVQRRGKGGSTFRASSHKRIAPSKYSCLSKDEIGNGVKGQVKKLLHESGRGAPLAIVTLENRRSYYSVIPEGVYEKQEIEMGEPSSINVGNILPVGKIPEGTMICNIELSPGDGGKIARSSGTYATIISHTQEGTMIRLPSGKPRYVNDLCLATIGAISAAGRVEKPFLKAGSKYHWMKSKGHKYPRTRGRAMIAAVHPFGSGRRGSRKVTTVSRNAPAGRKVGLISARRTGLKKR
jgi:large subunit ribosomal protein L2